MTLSFALLALMIITGHIGFDAHPESSKDWRIANRIGNVVFTLLFGLNILIYLRNV